MSGLASTPPQLFGRHGVSQGDDRMHRNGYDTVYPAVRPLQIRKTFEPTHNCRKICTYRQILTLALSAEGDSSSIRRRLYEKTDQSSRFSPLGLSPRTVLGELGEGDLVVPSKISRISKYLTKASLPISFGQIMSSKLQVFVFCPNLSGSWESNPGHAVPNRAHYHYATPRFLWCQKY